MVKTNNINKQKRMLIFYVINIVLFIIVIALSITVLVLTNTNTSEPTTEGLYPSIGLGNYFPESELDHWIDELALALYEKNGVPQMYERVRDLILENYTLIDGTYYYNGYEIPPDYSALILQFSIYFFIFAVLLVIGASALLLFIHNVYKKEEYNTKWLVFTIAMSILSLNIYSSYKMIKALRKDE